jgi:hypothetical protein
MCQTSDAKSMVRARTVVLAGSQPGARIVWGPSHDDGLGSLETFNLQHVGRRRNANDRANVNREEA